MKNWFPLTDYEFYAFLSAGIIIIAAFDVVFGGSLLVTRTSWTVASGAFWVIVAYFTGQLLAGPSSSFLEHLIGRRLFRAPVNLLLGFQTPRWRENLICVIAGAREYRPFSSSVSTSINAKAEALLGAPPSDAEAVYQIAFPKARTSPDTAKRLDNFSNVYGMCRNVSFAALVSTAILIYGAVSKCDATLAWYALGAFVFAFGMFGRFMKFYAAYSREVLRTFNSLTP